MANFRNSGGPEYKLQNEWTAYLEIAIQHARQHFISRSKLIAAMEIPGVDDLDDKPVGNSNSVYSIFEYINQQYDFDALIKMLPEQVGAIVSDKILSDKTFAEIAAQHGLSENTVKSIYYRALKKLRWWLV